MDAGPPQVPNGMWAYHLSLLKLLPSALWDGFSKVFTLIGIIGIVLLAFSRPLGLGVLNWDISPWWALVPTALLALYGLLRANYLNLIGLKKERDKLKQENVVLHADAEELFQDTKKLTKTVLELLPYKKHVDEQIANDEKERAAFEATQPARDLTVTTQMLVDEINKLVEKEASWRTQPLRGLYGNSPDKLVQDYDARLAPQVAAVRGEYFDNFKMTSPDLDKLCSERPRTIETIKNIREALDGLRLRLRPMTGWS